MERNKNEVPNRADSGINNVEIDIVGESKGSYQRIRTHGGWKKGTRNKTQY